MKFAMLLLCFIACIQAVFGETADEAWEKFKAEHRKGLKRSAEALRKTTFVSRWRRATEHNKKFTSGQTTFGVALGEDADIPLEIIRKFRNGRAYNTGNATAINPEVLTNMRGSIPASVDWRKRGIVTPVKQQGSCGSDYSFSTAAYLESQLLKANIVKSINLSEQQTVDCSRAYGNNGCDGGVERNVFKYYQTIGQQREDTYSYQGTVGTCKANRLLGIVAVTRVYNKRNLSKDHLKSLVATRGPICVGMYAGDKLLQDYKTGIYSCPLCPTDLSSLDHAVLLVGYGTENGREYWLIKNSWGANWGQNGFAKIDMSKNNVGIRTDITFADWIALPSLSSLQ